MQSLQQPRRRLAAQSLHHYTTASDRSETNGKSETSSSGKPGYPHLSNDNISVHLSMQLDIFSKAGKLDMAMETLAYMDRMCSFPSPSLHCHAYLSLMKACTERKSLVHITQLLVHLLHRELESSTILGERLVVALVKCGGFDDALCVFNRLPTRTVLSWTAIISGFAESGQGMEVFGMFNWMQKDGIEPNQYTYVSLIKACGISYDAETGRQLHEEICIKGSLNAFIGSALVNMYGKCGYVSEAENVFMEFLSFNPVCWNAMLSMYVNHSQGKRALLLYRQMHAEGVRIDERTSTIILQACVNLLDQCDAEGKLKKMELFDIVQSLHADVLKMGFASVIYVGNNLLRLYGKLGRFSELENAFNDLLDRNIVSWSTIISAYIDQCEGKKALLLCRQMMEEGLKLDEMMFVIALKACSSLCLIEENTFPLEIGQAIHADADKEGLASHCFVSNALINMYSKCGSITRAEFVFGSQIVLNLVSWNSMLSAYVECGLEINSLQLYRQMRQEGIKLDQWSYTAVFQACCILAEKVRGTEGKWRKVLFKEIVQALYMEVRREMFITDPLVCTMLINMYSKCMELDDVKYIFSMIPKDDVKVWNAMILAYTEQEMYKKALKLYREMQEFSVHPDERTFLIVFQTCGAFAHSDDVINREGFENKSIALEITRALHVDVRDKGFLLHTNVTNGLLLGYSKCGSIAETEALFHSLPRDCRTVVVWNAMLSIYVAEGEAKKALLVYRQLLEEHVSPKELTFIIALQACGLLAVQGEMFSDDTFIDKIPLEIGRALHADTVKKKFTSKCFVSNTIINAYCKCRSIQDAENMFNGLIRHNVVSWSVLMSAYVDNCQGVKALQIYAWMQKQGISPDDRTLTVALQACYSLVDKDDTFVQDEKSAVDIILEIGHALHVDAVKSGVTSNLYVENTLVSIYGKCGVIFEAEEVFKKMQKRDVVSWNAIFSVFLDLRDYEKVLYLYKEMQECRIIPDEGTFSIILQACAVTGDEERTMANDEITRKTFSKICYSLHHNAVWKGLSDNFLVGSTIVTTYSKLGYMNDAKNVFDALQQPTMSAWNCLLAAYVDQNQPNHALELYGRMKRKRVLSDDSTIVSVLQACSVLGAMELCRQLHFSVVASGFCVNPRVATSLVHAYGSCASTTDSREVLDQSLHSDVVQYSACIAGYALEGNCHQSYCIFENMKQTGTDPNEVTFLSLISSLNHAGLVDVGLMFFASMINDYYITPTLKHYSAMIELLSRAGDFQKVGKLMRQMSVHGDIVTWSTLLGACITHGNLEIGKQTFEQIICSDPTEVVAYVLMSNVCVDAN